jgi:hypothetical protein
MATLLFIRCLFDLPIRLPFGVFFVFKQVSPLRG